MDSISGQAGTTKCTVVRIEKKKQPQLGKKHSENLAVAKNEESSFDTIFENKISN